MAEQVRGRAGTSSSQGPSWEEMSAASERLRRSPRAVVYDGLAIPQLPTEMERRRAREELGLAAEGTFVLFAGQIIEAQRGRRPDPRLVVARRQSGRSGRPAHRRR